LTILAISGSLRARSSSGALLELAARLAPDGMALARYDGLAGLPHFNPDLDTDAPPDAVRALRAAFCRADGVVISSPEYAHGVPGALKNALDWMVRDPEFAGKPVALLNASTRATHAHAALAETLVTMAARLVAESCIAVPVLGRSDVSEIAADPEVAEPLRAALVAFERAIAPDRAVAHGPEHRID
jgi:NAD(P)H-dependent FMN reductase